MANITSAYFRKFSNWCKYDYTKFKYLASAIDIIDIIIIIIDIINYIKF